MSFCVIAAPLVYFLTCKNRVFLKIKIVEKQQSFRQFLRPRVVKKTAFWDTFFDAFEKVVILKSLKNTWFLLYIQLGN